MCGNAARCIGKFVYERGMTADTAFSLDTRSGIRALQLQVQDGRVESVTVDMGTPVLNPSEIPVDLPGQMVLRHRLQVLGQMWFITCVSMGNPHCVIFVRDPEVLDLNSIGPAFEHYFLFPRRTNVEFVRVISRDVLQMRVWERGTGRNPGLRHGRMRGAGGGGAVRSCRPQGADEAGWRQPDAQLERRGQPCISNRPGRLCV